MDNTQITIAILQMILTAITAIAASSGFWLFISKKSADRELSRRLLLGLTHDRIICLSMKYIERGWVTQDEHENLMNCLYKPYQEMGANGSTDRLIKEVNSLPLFSKDEHIREKLAEKQLERTKT